jgi:hypothetical protein
MINARQTNFKHLALEFRAVATRQSVLVKPRVHHLMEQRGFHVLWLSCEKRRGQFDDGWTMPDAPGN